MKGLRLSDFILKIKNITFLHYPIDNEMEDYELIGNIYEQS